jgi:hypothetical protein
MIPQRREAPPHPPRNSPAALRAGEIDKEEFAGTAQILNA